MKDINYAMDAWLGELARAGRSKATRLKYQQVLWQFADFLDERDCDTVTVDHCRRFLDRWVEASPSTRALYVSVLRGFFQFLVDLDHRGGRRTDAVRDVLGHVSEE